jgi:hypothetical protein
MPVWRMLMWRSASPDNLAEIKSDVIQADGILPSICLSICQVFELGGFLDDQSLMEINN